MKPLLASFLGALFVMSVAATPAAAQKASAAERKIPAPAIAILDVQRLLRDSAAAKSLRPQIQRLKAKFETDVRDREKALRKSEQDLLGQRAILAPEAFASRRRQFEERARAARNEVRNRRRALDRALARAMQQIRVALIKVAGIIATERKINIVMPKSSVVMSLNTFEITAETMKRLDKSLPSIKVTVESPKKKK